MKKNLLFVIALIAVAVLLFLLRVTDMTAHIIVSVIGLALLIAYTLVSKKEWKNPALEIGMRVFYAIALITGIVLKVMHGNDIISIIHKVSAVLFVIFLADTEIHKALKSKKSK